MLEQQALLIRRAPAGWSILEPETGRPLGGARRRTGRGPWGFRWLARITFDVFEAEDEPLVFTVRRSWGFSPRWEVCDAEGNRVGTFQRGRVLDAFGQDWALLEETPQGIGFQGRDREFARVGKYQDGLRVDFAAELHGNPLAKMSLLAAVLVCEWRSVDRGG